MGNYYAFATLEELLAMGEEKQKAVYDFITMLNDLKKDGFKMNEPQEDAKSSKADAYESNDTMRMLGKQNIERYIDNEEVSKSIQDITTARGYDLKRNFNLIFDVFLYGCIIGRREERQKKKATNPNLPQ